jgi:hypothetical protein
MKRTLLAVPVISLIFAAHSAAQGPFGRGGQQAGTAAGASSLDMTRVRTVNGTVGAIDIGYGAEYPSFTLGTANIKAAPVWYFLYNDFELKAGDAVSVMVAPSTLPGDSYLYAVAIANTKTGAKLVLRDSNGMPLWSGPTAARGNGDGIGAGTCTGCVDPKTIATVTGAVEKVVAGVGILMPSLVLKGADGKLVTIKIGPERSLLEADFEIKAGDRMTARYACATCSDEYIALQLMNATGVVLTLRNDDGTPAWNQQARLLREP